MVEMERGYVLKALVGSHNYNLATPESDKDYKVFVMPTFRELYTGEMYSKAIIGAQFDYDIHDVRKLVNLFWKANINFLEILYSKERHCFDPYVNAIYLLRKELVRMNLPYLYNACKGMHFEKMRRLDKASHGTAHFIEQYGYNTKEALHAYRVLDFIIRFAATEFEDFEWAMTYDEQEREKMLGIKHGHYSRIEFEKLVQDKLDEFEGFARYYSAQNANETLRVHLDSVICDMVREGLF